MIELRVLNPEENPYRKPIREGVAWNKEVQDAFEEGNAAQHQADLKALDEYRCPECDTPNFIHFVMPLKDYQSIKQLVKEK